ncbi:histidine--tRNA ligase [Ilyobacter polytropus]|uniref:Histidine--tRNA ligase n=1 Tax=Ilyobacter polytropus (strain ATCC 51220 / DSM 2926 / LMG 16218 / CuHBu1) TaxID=572544 RepID=E3HB58_ILYPC|nr:histidine--tRNA ligase [Ilyobacter polytropus]ADO82209.1 histidyl-tRNA synthetase [Ilyobacter polytropus DSM 2926]
MKLLKAVRGTKDIFGEDALKYNHIVNTAKEVFEAYGYSMIKIPIFEETNLFKRGIGEGTDVVEKEMYTFTDRGDRSITLRPEGTASVVRSYLEHKIYGKEEFTRYYYTGSMFRYERPQAGRQREFNQLGIEALGEGSPILDAEVIAMSYTLLEKLGITDLEVNINSVGGNESRSKYRDTLINFLTPSKDELCEDCRARYERNPLRVLDCKNPKCKEITEEAPSIIDSLNQEEREHYESVKKYLDIFGIKYRENSRLVRGLDYYSSTVYEVITNKLGSQGTVLGGGRYDNLLKQLGNKEIPAVGFAAGIERLMMLLEDYPKNNPEVFIAWLGKDEATYAFGIAKALRDAGIKTCIEFSSRSLKASMKKADKLGVGHAIIIGDEEMANKKMVLKNFQERTQETLSIEDVIKRLKK